MKNTTKISFKNVVILFFTICWVVSGYAQCPNVVWEDEFTGSSLDLAKWNYQTGDGCAEGICGWGNNELQSYQEANVSVSNGTLKITARKERIRGSKYTSGRINTKGKADFTYGRFEALIKLPAGDGLWPAFWMLSTQEPYGSWPQSGEIDIMEFVAAKQDEVLGTIHYGDLYPNNQSQGDTYRLSQGVFPDGFHEFAIEWEPDEIRWFVDGVLYATKKPEDIAPYNWPFDSDFHFLLNVAVGGNLGGTVNDTMLPATMEVDYVRVYDGFKPHLSGAMVVSHQAQNVVYTLANIGTNVNVNWTVPQGATIVSGQGTGTITVNFGSESGVVSAVYDDGCAAETLSMYVEVEPPYLRAFSFENFDDPATAVFSSATGTHTELSNPAPNTVNGSALCAKYDRNATELYDLVIYDVSNISDASLYVNKDKKFYLDVYTPAPVGTEIILQLETPDATPSNYPTGRHSRYITTITENNNWQRLEFSLLDRPDGGASDTAVNTMILLFASNSNTSDTYYYDNLDSYDADTGTGSNQSPTVSISSPSNGATYTQGLNITIEANASDADGTVSQVEFFADGTSVGVDTTSPYSINWQVSSGTTTLTAVATDNEGAATTSSPISVTGESGGNPSSVHVSSITTGTASAGQGNKYGTASVTIVDDLGSPVAGATVTGTFSGTFNEQGTSQTDTNGIAFIQTQATAKGSVTVNFCVDDVQHATLSYEATNNVVSCSGSSAKVSEDKTGSFKLHTFTMYPNPSREMLWIISENSSSKINLTVFDLSGKVLMNQQIQTGTDYINISHLAAGMYLIKLQNTGGVGTMLRLVKQ